MEGPARLSEVVSESLHTALPPPVRHRSPSCIAERLLNTLCVFTTESGSGDPFTSWVSVVPDPRPAATAQIPRQERAGGSFKAGPSWVAWILEQDEIRWQEARAQARCA